MILLSFLPVQNFSVVHFISVALFAFLMSQFFLFRSPQIFQSFFWVGWVTLSLIPVLYDRSFNNLNSAYHLPTCFTKTEK
jgi:hypothetical protein